MKRSKHSLTHYRLLSQNMGSVTPIGLIEVLPGDTVQHATNMFIRMAPSLAPPMHPVHMKVYHFFVPNRLLWDQWEDFITGGPDGMDMSEFPTVKLKSETDGSGTGDVGSLADYLGVPTGIDGLEVSALPFRAYNFIWNEYFRDADLMTEAPISTDGGVDTTTGLERLYACWEKDYFTSARPFEQLGPQVTIPIGDRAPVYGVGFESGSPVFQNGAFKDMSGAHSAGGKRYAAGDNQSGRRIGVVVNSENNPDVWTDLSEATGITIEQLRYASALQRYAENRARFGHRYHEYLAALGVRSSDARLQRPEYLAGGSQTLQFSEVLQTAEGDNPVGTLRGHGIAAFRSNRYRKFFEEHGFILSFAVCRPKAMYVDGLQRHWNRRVREDFYQKEFANLGQQKVLNKEVYAAHTSPDGTFGYQDRYDEYRHQPSTVSGEFRTDELNYWHFAREFANQPALNSDFVECIPTMRPFGDYNADPLRVMAHHSVQARRIIPYAARPQLF